MAIAGTNMWSLLLDKDPGHSVAATDLAVNVVELKLKKATATTAVKVEVAPSARNVAKPAKHVNKAKMNTKSATGFIKQAEAAPAAIVDGGGKGQINGAAGDIKQAAATDDGVELTNMWIRRYLSQQTSKEEEEEAVFTVVPAGGGRRTVAPRTRKPTVVEGATVTGTNMWALLPNKDPGNSTAASDLAVEVVDRKLKKAAVIAVKVKDALSARNVAKPAKRVSKEKMNTKIAAGCSKQAEVASAAIVDGGKVQINGAPRDNKQAAGADDDEELTNMWMRRYYLSQEESKKEDEEAMFSVVAARGGRRRTVAPPTRKPTVAESVTVTGANMWALLRDEEPANSAEVEEAPPADNVDGTNVDVRSGQGSGSKLAKRGNKTKTKKKKTETPAAPPIELEEEVSEEEEEMSGEVTTGGSRCRTVVSRVCRAVVAVALLGLYCRFASASPV